MHSKIIKTKFRNRFKGSYQRNGRKKILEKKLN